MLNARQEKGLRKPEAFPVGDTAAEKGSTDALVSQP